jgi:hypothetical protein
MDFRQTPQTAAPRVAPAASPVAHENKDVRETKNKGGKKSRWLQISQYILLVGITILLVGIAFAFTRSTGNVNSSEAKFVDTSKYQAVFLNNGQVYFGNITNLNDQYVRLKHIYYLTQSSSATSSSSSSASDSYSLVKLGCQQIHDPTDQMVINRSQVTFWENLSDSGKVVSSIKQFIKQNPNGPDCSQVSSQTQASPNSSQSSQNSSGTDTTGSSSTTGK